MTAEWPTATLAWDPSITDATGDTRVDRHEMRSRHGVPPADGGAGAPGGAGAVVGFQDSGLDEDHPYIREQAGSVREFRDYTGNGRGDDVGHGTAVAGMATRYAAGPDVVVHRIFGTSGSGASGVMESLDRAVKLARAGELDAWNMSWGAGRRVPAIDAKVNELARAGCVPVAASGNTGGSTGSPATAKLCVSVGALQEDGRRMTRFSSWDQDGDPDPGAPGVPEVCGIGKNLVLARAAGTSMGTPLDSERTVASGTSFPTPFVTGLAADMVRRFGDAATALGVLGSLEDTAVDIPGTARDGLGRVHWRGAVMEGPAPPGPETAPARVWKVPIFPGRTYLSVRADVADAGRYEALVGRLREALR